MRFLILSDLFSLDSWLIEDQEPDIMPAVYEFFKYLGRSEEHIFAAYIIHKSVTKTIRFENGSEIHISPLGVPQHYVRKFFSLFAMYKLGRRAIREEQFDVVYGLGVYSIVAGKLGRRFGLPSVSRLFGSLVHDVMSKGQYVKLYTRFILQYLEAKRPADIIICTEDGTEFDTALQQLNPTQTCHMLYNGMNPVLKEKLLALPAIESIDTQEPISCISIGRLTQWKRHDLAIRVIYYLRLTHNLDVSLTIVGKGEERSALVKLVGRLGLGDCVVFKDSIPHGEIVDELERHEIGLFLYDVSNLGNAFWEACLSGRLMVTRWSKKMSGVFAGDHGNIIDSDDPEIIAEQLAMLLKQDFSHIPYNSRQLIDKLFVPWELRFKEELDIIGNIPN